MQYKISRESDGFYVVNRATGVKVSGPYETWFAAKEAMENLVSGR